MKLTATANPRERQEELGQFLTASSVAGLMASMFGQLPQTVRLLDAGAGAGALTLAFVSRCCEKPDGVGSIEATLYEIDTEILASLEATMRECERRWIGFENHLNYFHANGHGMERHLATGLYAFLNSTVVDQYFRRFSGHTQVNATDLRTLPYPDVTPKG